MQVNTIKREEEKDYQKKVEAEVRVYPWECATNKDKHGEICDQNL